MTRGPSIWRASTNPGGHPVALRTADQVRQAVQAVSFPVNATALPATRHGAGDLAAQLKHLL